MKAPRTLACAAWASLLAGCALLDLAPPAPAPEPPPWIQPGSARPVSDVDSLVQYYQHIRNLSTGDAGREYEVARQAYNGERNAFNRVRLAMMLSLPDAAFQDDSRALDLLEPVVRNANGRLHALALMLSSHLQEQKRLNASVQGLQQKLDALKSLERSLIERSR